ncbi:MAG: Hsp33 family molecular chaperone HslO [Duodenibacillus sp.]
MSDTLVKLHFPEQSCRAQVLHLDQAFRRMIEHQDLPTAVRHLLGELTAAAVMLAAGLKFKGALVVQLQGDGPVKLALVEVRTGLLVRATAQLRVPPEAVAETADFKSLVNASGNGRCAVILDMDARPAGEQPYQGVVPLTGETVAQTLESFMTQSEQLPTKLWLAAGDNAVGGVMLQHVASTGGIQSDKPVDPEGFEHLTAFAATVKSEELLTLEADEVARRLFWEDNPTVLETLCPAFACKCSREGIEKLLRDLGREEVEDIIDKEGTVDIRCEFCGRHYVLDAIDAAALFASGSTASRQVN